MRPLSSAVQAAGTTSIRIVTTLLAALLLGPPHARAASVPLDLTGVRAGPIAVVRSGDAVTVTWPDETGRIWRATFSLDPAQPLITSIGPGGVGPGSVGPDGGAVVRSARPFYRGETGKRRGGWDAFFDDPTSHPDATRHVQGAFTLRGAVARSVGERLEIVFDGFRMGSFDGGLAYTFYPGSRLVQQDAIVTTYDADVAYYYDAGLDMAAGSDRQPGNNMRTESAYYDTDGVLRRVTLNGLQPERIPVQVRYRTLAVKTAGGSVAVFPAPHQYFFPRDFTSNLGYVWHRAWRGRVSLGIRQLRDENWQFYPWVNAPPGRPQHMRMFLLLSWTSAETTLGHVLRFTNADRFPALAGYKTLGAHWHLAFTEQALANGFKWTPPFKPVLKAMGVDAAMVMDFHGDGHPNDLTDLRLDELHAYFEALRAQSDPDFLLIPAEEANVHLGGHWAVVFPKPVYWFMNRPQGSVPGGLVATHPKYGTVYSPADAKEMFEVVRREGGYMYQTHPRTKGSTGFPDRILATDYFRDASYLGVGWKALPSDLSSPRLGDRAFDLLDELNNRGLHKRLLGEVDVFQFDHTHELYAHMNVNYVRLDRLPSFEQWGDALAPLANGEFFTTTGEVLLPDVSLASSTAAEIVVKARVHWTFPLQFAEIVWGDGETTHRKTIELTATREFGSQTFEWRTAASGWTWARVAVWDVAGNGAFVNPFWRP
jgi:hypothetical protein